MGRRFLTLDAYRGVAALMVVLMHYALGAKASGQLAVDLFFMLSGFVIAHAYEERLGEGMTLRRFAWVRICRLYPTLLFAVLMMAMFLTAQAILGTPPSHGWMSFCTVIFSLFVVPIPPELTNSLYLFPLNGAAWSLFWELIANLLYALAGRRLASRTLLAIVAIFGGLMILIALQRGGINGGSEWRTFANGFVRTGFGFTLGMLGYRMLPRLGPGRPHGVAFVVLLGVLAAALQFAPFTAATHVFLLFIAFPLLLFLGAHVEPPKAMEGAAEEAGRLSYTLYLTHQPLWMWMVVVGGKIMTPEVARSTPYKWLVLACALLLAWGVERLWERPLRRWLAQGGFRFAAPGRQPAE